MLTTILLASLAVCLLGWHRCHEQLRRERLDRVFLEGCVDELDRQVTESRNARRRARPSPSYWGSPVLDEIWEDIQRVGRLQVVENPSEGFPTEADL